MIKNLVFLLFFVLSFSSQPSWAKNCKKGQPCGNSCISWKYTCHKNTNKLAKSYSSTVSISPIKPSIRPFRHSSTSVIDMYVIADRLNVRRSPNSDFEPVGILVKNTRVRTYSPLGYPEWKAVFYKGRYFWASAKYLSYKRL